MVTEISAFKKKYPRSPISTSVLMRHLQTQGRISPSIPSCAEPKAPSGSSLGPKRIRKVIHPPTLHPGSHFSARASRRIWSPPPPLAPKQEPLPALGTFGDISTAANRDEFESGPIKDEGWVIHADFSCTKLGFASSPFAACEGFIKENIIKEPLRKQREKTTSKMNSLINSLLLAAFAGLLTSSTTTLPTGENWK